MDQKGNPLTTCPIQMGWEFTLKLYPRWRFRYIGDPDNQFGNGSVWTQTRTRSDGPETLWTLTRTPQSTFKIRDRQCKKKRWNHNGRVIFNVTRGINTGHWVNLQRHLSDSTDVPRPLWRSHSAQCEIIFANVTPPKSLTLSWQSFSEWGGDRVAFSCAYNGCQYNGYAAWQPHQFSIKLFTRPKISDIPLTLIVRMRQWLCRFAFCL